MTTVLQPDHPECSPSANFCTGEHQVTVTGAKAVQVAVRPGPGSAGPAAAQATKEPSCPADCPGRRRRPPTVITGHTGSKTPSRRGAEAPSAAASAGHGGGGVASRVLARIAPAVIRVRPRRLISDPISAGSPMPRSGYRSAGTRRRLDQGRRRARIICQSRRRDRRSRPRPGRRGRTIVDATWPAPMWSFS